MSMSAEQSLASARASVMIYDDLNKRWIHSGSSSGLSKVHIYNHVANNTFRVVGRKLQDHEVVINCAILKGLKYNKATATFHQWRDNRQVYGLNFSSKEEADNFSLTMQRALEKLNQNNVTKPLPPPPVPNHQFQQQQSGYQQMGDSIPDDHKFGTKEDTDGERRQSLVQYSNNSVGNSHPPTPPQQNGHQRTSSGPAAPPAPHPPPMPVMSAVPPPPPPPPLNAKAPPAPPPPPMSGAHTLPRTGPSSESGGIGGTSLAVALQGAKLRKTSSKSPEGGGNCESARPGPVNLMDEISKTLARRRAQVENHQNSQDREREGTSKETKRPRDKQNSVNGSSPNKASGPESPKLFCRSRIDSSSEGEFSKTNSLECLDLERLKQDILVEVKRELNQAKQEILDAIRIELSRR
ncbi:vasodilator-stimulated phosphoprotein-like isoform X2 [Tachypleus tridentatus]|uniref:vasodilator-stimulated phosphoprotein-like isoform X2 n=1 Tax=Tachypleus tridentatus TaxID=6853 RepID=UPI003FD4934A